MSSKDFQKSSENLVLRSTRGEGWGDYSSYEILHDVSKYVLDIDECQESRPCIKGRCENVEGSFVCRCDEGYMLDATGRRCMGKDRLNARTTSLLASSFLFWIGTQT